MRLGAVLGDSPEPRSLLAVGSGNTPLPDWEARGFNIVRLDIEPSTNPDILASMTDMGPIGPFDTVLCSHALEHLYPHEVHWALAEFYRVLKPGGTAVVLVPDLEGVAPTDDKLPGTELSGLHLYYGDAGLIPQFPHMAHHCGFVASTLKACMEMAGFKVTTDRASNYNLMGLGTKV